MPERIEKLKATVLELEAELATLGPVDQETREMLEVAIEEIGDALRRTDTAALAGQHSLANRLQEMAESFESSHPNIAGILGRMINALGQMGI